MFCVKLSERTLLWRKIDLHINAKINQVKKNCQEVMQQHFVTIAMTHNMYVYLRPHPHIHVPHVKHTTQRKHMFSCQKL